MLICFGVGMLLGTFGSVELIERYTTNGAIDWKPVFLIMAVASAALMVALLALFRDDARPAAQK